MSSIREQAIAAVIAALNVGGAPVTTERTRRAAISEGASLLAIVVRPARSTTEEIDKRMAHALTRQTLTLDVEMFATGTDTLRPDQVVDGLYVWVISKLIGNSLGGLVHTITEGDSEFEWGDPGEYSNVKLTTQMVVSFQYVPNNAALKT